MVKRVIWTSKAKTQRRNILSYWKKRNGNNTYSRKLSREFKHKISLVKSFNLIGQQTDDDEIRFIVCFDYLIFYEIHTEEILILAVWDSRQNPANLKITM